MIKSAHDIISPLRYPGSKQALVPYVIRFLEENRLRTDHLYEAFAGGASISISLLKREVIKHATLIEKDPLIYAFWECVKSNPAILCERVRTLDVSMKTWKSFQKFREADALKKYALMDLGLAGLFFNRTNYSGIIGANPIGGMSQDSEYKINCRFTKDTIITRICEVASFSKRLTVVHGDAVSILRQRKVTMANKKAIVYIDPPYYAQGQKLYRYHFFDKDHTRLARFLNSSEFPWLVSYDNEPFIAELFREKLQRPIRLQYTVRQARSAEELIITNQMHLPDATFSTDRAVCQDVHVSQYKVFA